METSTCSSRFARPEWERRFLVARMPGDLSFPRVRQIVDRYITGTSLRLRRMSDPEGSEVYKLTQKLCHNAAGANQGQLTTIYLSRSEYQVFASLSASLVEKTRYSVPPFGIDVFSGSLTGLIIAEAEFNSAEEAAALHLPAFISHEVTSDPRFAGGSLSVATRNQLTAYLEEFRILPTLD